MSLASDAPEIDGVRSLFLSDGDTVTPTILSTGPWSTTALHGGPVAALLARSLEAVPTPVPMFPARLTVELLRPVGFEVYRVECRVVRAGKRVQVLEALLVRAEDGEAAARATLQQIQAAPVALPGDADAVNPDGTAPPSPEACTSGSGTLGLPSFDEGVRFHTTAVEHRATAPFFMTLGPATDWIRLRYDLFPDEPLSPLQRVAAAADFGNGISGILPFDRYVFVNPDLTIHLYRLPADEWVCLDAVTRVDPSPGAGGIALAESALFDRRGRIGRSLQSLLVSELPGT